MFRREQGTGRKEKGQPATKTKRHGAEGMGHGAGKSSSGGGSSGRQWTEVAVAVAAGEEIRQEKEKWKSGGSSSKGQRANG
jgi:hypothetical protein